MGKKQKPKQKGQITIKEDHEVLLPETINDFRDVHYWNRFFSERHTSFEWYGEFNDFKSPLKQELENIINHVSTHLSGTTSFESLKMLHLGCGNSSLAIDIYNEFKCSNIINVDFSESVIDRMKQRFPDTEYPGIEWRQCDLKNDGLTKAFPNTSFNVVLDKAFLDSYLSTDNEAEFNVKETADQLLMSIFNILSPGGAYILISLMQPYIATALTAFIVRNSIAPTEHQKYNFDSIHVLPFRTANGVRRNEKLHPYLIVILKGSANSSAPLPQLPMCHILPTDMCIPSDLFKAALLPRKIQEITLTRQLDDFMNTRQPGKCHHVALHSTNQRLKYSITLYDSINNNACKVATAAILIPLGQETDWLFQTAEGNQQLSEQCDASRLLLIALGPAFDNQKICFEKIKTDISPYLIHLALPNSDQIPILTLTDNLGSRVEVASVPSNYTKIYVYDYDVTTPKKLHTDSDCIYTRKRRVMTFENNPRLIQSELELVRKEGDKDFTFDFIESCTDYYAGVLAGFGLFPSNIINRAYEIDFKCLLLGVGGGILVNLLKIMIGSIFETVHVTAVELDPAVIHIARTYFGYSEDSSDKTFSLETIIADGFDIIQHASCNTYTLIILDINSPTREDALLCPPKEFLSFSNLKNIHDALLDDGLLILNLVTRSNDSRKKAYKSITDVFGNVFSFSIHGEMNHVVICRKTATSTTASADQCTDNLHDIKIQILKNLKYLGHYKQSNSWISGYTDEFWIEHLEIS